MSAPKRHHYVPQMYLERFAGPDGRLLVRRRDGKTFTTKPRNVAVETGFYDVDVGNGSVSKEVEHMLSDLEGLTAHALRSIDQTGKAPAPGSEERDVLSAFLAMQHVRTPVQRQRILFWDRLAQYLDGRELSPDLVASFLRDVHLREEPSDAEVRSALTFAQGGGVPKQPPDKNESISLMLNSLPKLAATIDRYVWTVEHERKGRLITSDAPLVLWRPPSHRDQFEGIGIETATEIRLPLDPTKQLVLSRTTRPPSVRVSPRRADECNRVVMADCHQFCIANPSDEPRVSQVPMKEHHPVMRFNAAPFSIRHEDGSLEDQGDRELFHMWVPRG